MRPFNFDRFIRIEAAPVIKDLMYAMGGEVSIHGADERFLVGDDSEKPWARRYEVMLCDELLGWVYGAPRCMHLARFLSHMAEHRVDMRDKYAEFSEIQRENAVLERELSRLKARLARTEEKLAQLGRQ